MKIFKELKKLGYKHYTEHTVEELDDLPLDSEERIMEQALVLRWFREKYNLISSIESLHYGCELSMNRFLYKIVVKTGVGTFDIYDEYEEAELACLIKLIEIVKKK